MAQVLSIQAVKEYLPALCTICASLEIELMKYHDELEKRNSFDVVYLRQKMGSQNLYEGMDVISILLNGTPYRVQELTFSRTDAIAKWWDMLQFLKGKIAECYNDAPVIELTLSNSGRITRSVGGVTLTHDFEGESSRLDFIRLLTDHVGYTATEELMKSLGFKTEKALSGAKKTVNDILQNKLQLPHGKELIDSKRNSGYRINPMYNIVRIP